MSVTYDEEIVASGVRKVILSGTLDAPNTMAIEDAFQDVLVSRRGQVIIDLSNVDYMSSYGLRMLMVGARAMMEVDGGLHLAGANMNVMEVIKITGYDTMFPVYDTVEEAVEALTD